MGQNLPYGEQPACPGTDEGRAGACTSEPEKACRILKECAEAEEKRLKRVSGQSQGQDEEGEAVR